MELGKKAPSIKLSPLRFLLQAVLPLRVLGIEDTLRYSLMGSSEESPYLPFSYEKEIAARDIDHVVGFTSTLNHGVGKWNVIFQDIKDRCG
jgi:hypothetical protein